MAAPALWGSEIIVNGLPEGDQTNVKSVALQDGTFFVVWYDGSPSADGSGSAVRGQFFNADGTKKGSELLVNTTTANDQEAPVVGVLNDGRLVVAWRHDVNPDPNIYDFEIRARIISSDNPLAGSDFMVSTSAGVYPQSITALAEGGFVIAYSGGSDGSSGSVRAQAFNAFGDRIGGEILLNKTTAGLQSYPYVVGLSNGNYAAFYTDFSQTGDDTSGTAIRGRIFSATGQEVVTEFLVNTATKGDQAVSPVTLLKDGRMVVLWISEDGGFGDGSGTCIKGQILNADGTKYRGEFLVNTTTRGDQIWPSITALSDGGFAVAFMDANVGSGDTNIRVGIFNADGQLRSEDAIATAATTGLQEYPSLIELNDGRLFVTWTDRTDPSADRNVHGQILDPRDHATLFTGTALNDQSVGTRFGDTLSGKAGTDRLRGEGGDDILSGGSGADHLDGGAGHDTVSYADSGPVIVNLVTGANSDGDTLISIEGVIGSAAGDMLTGSQGHILQGAGGDDIYMVSGNALVIETGGQGSDTVIASGSYNLSRAAEVAILRFADPASAAGFSLEGSDTANQIAGNRGANLIHGWGGNDVLRGDLGTDQLWGDAGRDAFVFDTKPNKSTNKDKIVDFIVKDDSLYLENKIFTKLGKAGTSENPAQLKKAFFTIGTKAKDRNDYLVSDDKKGVLSYDADGSGKGKAVEIATLSKKLAMTYKDFFVI